MGADAWPEPEKFERILAEAQDGSESAFEQLYRSYAGAITGYARMQGIPDPEDCANEVFIGVIKSLAKFRGDEPAFRSWIFTIAHHRIVDMRRRAARHLSLVPVEHDELDRPAEDDPAAEAVDSSATENVRRLCEQLVPDQRDVMLMRLVGGLTIDEIAKSLDKTPGAVKALQRRGLAALKKNIDSQGVPL